ncbi:MAG TPA: hypothetical protein VHX59_01205 [Mycobacteriales bacterium]|jgi:hypothetical protein|nr:hypothetical protein [Mycobacteriales bacterium]
MSASDVAIETVNRWVRSARAMPAPQVGLRVLLGVLGVAGFAVLHQPWASAAGFLTVIGLLGVLATMVLPDSAAAALVLGTLIAEWLLAYGIHGSPPVVTTLLLALDLYLVHTVAALCGAMPASAELDRQLLVRWSGHIGLTLVASGVVVAIGYGVGHLPGSLTLELLGLLGAVAVVAVPVWLVHGRR